MGQEVELEEGNGKGRMRGPSCKGDQRYQRDSEVRDRLCKRRTRKSGGLTYAPGGA